MNLEDLFTPGTFGCYFYTTEEEFFSVAVAYLKEGLENSRERFLWILPPQFSFTEAREALARKLDRDLELPLRRRKLMLIPWDKWYGTEQAPHQLLKRSQQILANTLDEGFEGLRILSHSPHRTSDYWKDFFLHEETLPKRFKGKPVTSLCAYSLIDCPAQAISSIALNHSLCMIHRGSDWEWLVNKQPSNQLHL